MLKLLKWHQNVFVTLLIVFPHLITTERILFVLHNIHINYNTFTFKSNKNL